MCVLSDGNGMFGGLECTSDAWPLYLLFFVLCLCMTSSWDNQRAAAKASRHNQWEAAEADTIAGSSSWNKCNQGAVGSGHMRLSSACQRFYRIKVCRSRGLRGTHTDVVKEARPLTVDKQLLSLGNVAQDLLARQGMSGVEMPQYRNL